MEKMHRMKATNYSSTSSNGNYKKFPNPMKNKILIVKSIDRACLILPIQVSPKMILKQRLMSAMIEKELGHYSVSH